jgi:hypothetical protein
MQRHLNYLHSRNECVGEKGQVTVSRSQGMIITGIYFLFRIEYPHQLFWTPYSGKLDEYSKEIS